MKKLITVFFVTLTLLFTANPITAQESNINVNFPSTNVFEFQGLSNGLFGFNWKIPRYTGDTYQGQTAYEMLEWTVANSSYLVHLYTWSCTRSDENYIYGTAALEIGPSDTVTITGLSQGTILVDRRTGKWSIISPYTIPADLQSN